MCVHRAQIFPAFPSLPKIDLFFSKSMMEGRRRVDPQLPTPLTTGI
jgi:hypothetical protein